MNTRIHPENSHTTDVVIVGAGPVGLFSIFQCGMNNLSCHVVDTLSMVGGQCTALYPEKPIYDIPAHPSVTGEDLIHHLMTQAQPFHPVFHLDQQVMSITPLEKQNAHDDGFIVETSKGVFIRTKAIIIAAGVGAFGPNRPPLAGIEAFESKSVQYYIRSKSDFKDQRVVIAGGGDSAVDWAISLCDIAQRVQVVHRRAKFRCAPESERRLYDMAHQGLLDVITPYQLHSLHGDASTGHLTGVEIQALSGETRILDADVLLPFFGLSMNLGPILTWDLALEKQHITITPGTSQTSVPGIYAVGDVATYPHKQKLILCGFAEAAQGAHAIRRYLFPDESVHFEHSTTKFAEKPQVSVSTTTTQALSA